MNITKYIPNTITSLSLVCGCVACVQALQGNILYATLWIIAGAVFDFFDGFAARTFNAFSPIGKDLDSLADMVSFGVAPGMIIFTLLNQASSALPFSTLNALIPYLAFVIPVFSALRLAKFNIDTRQTTSFIGLPVPAHALFLSSAAYSALPIIQNNQSLFVICTLVVIFSTSYLLVSEIPMFSLKIKSLAWKGNELRYILIICSAIFIILWGLLGLAGAILLYIILSIFNKK
ncbi:CDP-diacylglycerol--serine O-phosphatidyltransferase [Massilibacteroides sp.]|uniref:CDP-diacylglycerol--serine O-phosphatidyltransferase n=1 Tax=Massilibacteroides sp. TaxID=2034766 RepID=UPI00262481A0|nr:CDP-diacylglycerol--serine O-phosphatidyltransferase [Massilibacteroides sp.]MDD4516182.1 CDP-diacylglycerol--serine O-phosphatidyltransferase [Massilibacteroides sp.]